MTALQYAGFTVSPLLGSALGLLGSGISPYWEFALPGFSIGLLAFYCTIALLSVFKNYETVPEIEPPATHASAENRSQRSRSATLFSEIRSRSATLFSENRSHRSRSASVIWDTTPSLNPLHHEYGQLSPRHSTRDIEIGASTNEDAPAYASPALAKTESVSPSPPPEPSDVADPQAARAVQLCTVALLLLNITTKGSISVYVSDPFNLCYALWPHHRSSTCLYCSQETLGAQIAMKDYGLSVFELGVLVTSCGTVGFLQLLLFRPLYTCRFTDLQLMLGGIAVMIVAQVVALTNTAKVELPPHVSSAIASCRFCCCPCSESLRLNSSLCSATVIDND